MQEISNYLFNRHARIRVILTLLLPITVSSARAQQYNGDGIPSGLEEEIRWLVNRGRFDSTAENAAQGTAYSDVPATSSALAPNQQLTLAGRHHSEDMAKNNAFQHETVTGSAHYNAVSQPSPWDRMEAEGYDWNSAGENIAAGYTGALAVYVGWWKSTGHRVNMYRDRHREIGNGHFEWPSSTYRHYYTMDLASSGNISFLTGTLFNDTNGNNRYEPSEAAAGITVSLIVEDVPHPQYDVSTAVGSFAIPIQSIPAGSRVEVMLSSTANTAINLSIPTAYSTYSTANLPPGQSITYGGFTRSAGVRNVGLREIIPIPAALPELIGSATRLPSGAIDRFTLSFLAASGISYTIEGSADAKSWQAIELGIAGDGTTVTRSYPAAGARGFFRLRLE
ncbi:MAG: CAP domain-containing protein [Verrucomicrobiales bacterium]